MTQETESVNIITWNGYGHIKMSFNNWTGTSKPEITKGSVIEIGGACFYAAADEDIDPGAGWGAIANDTLVYYMFGVSGTTATSEVTTTAPTWDDEKQGWYNAGLTKRYYLQVYKDGSGNYTQKTLMTGQNYGEQAEGLNLGLGANANRSIRFATGFSLLFDVSADSLTIDKTTTEGSQSIATMSTWVPDIGWYVFAGDAIGANYLTFEIDVSGTWYVCGDPNQLVLGFMYCDGTNMRIKNNHTSSWTVYYRKIM